MASWLRDYFLDKPKPKPEPKGKTKTDKSAGKVVWLEDVIECLMKNRIIITEEGSSEACAIIDKHSKVTILKSFQHMYYIGIVGILKKYILLEIPKTNGEFFEINRIRWDYTKDLEFFPDKPFAAEAYNAYLGIGYRFLEYIHSLQSIVNMKEVLYYDPKVENSCLFLRDDLKFPSKYMNIQEYEAASQLQELQLHPVFTHLTFAHIHVPYYLISKGQQGKYCVADFSADIEYIDWNNDLIKTKTLEKVFDFILHLSKDFVVKGLTHKNLFLVDGKVQLIGVSELKKEKHLEHGKMFYTNELKKRTKTHIDGMLELLMNTYQQNSPVIWNFFVGKKSWYE